MVLYGKDEMDNRQKVTYQLQSVKLKEDRNAQWEQRCSSSPRVRFHQWQEMWCRKAHEPGLSLQPVVFLSDCNDWIRDFRGHIPD